MNRLIRKTPGKEQQQVIFQSSLTLLPPRAGKAGAMVFAGGVLQCVNLGEQGAVLGQWAGAHSHFCLCSAQQLLPSLCTRSCAHTAPCLSQAQPRILPV